LATLNLCPQETDICISRGDSSPFSFQMVDSAGVDIVITGRTYILTVNAKRNPGVLDTPLFSVNGVVATPLVTFKPTEVQTDVSPQDYYYDVQETSGTEVLTVLKGKFTVQQDITK